MYTSLSLKLRVTNSISFILFSPGEIKPFVYGDFIGKTATITLFGKAEELVVQLLSEHTVYFNSYFTVIEFKLVKLTLNVSVFPACNLNILSSDSPVFVVILNDKSFTLILAIGFELLLVKSDKEKPITDININIIVAINIYLDLLLLFIILIVFVNFSFK